MQQAQPTAPSAPTPPLLPSAVGSPPVNHPISVTLQVPPERHDYLADGFSFVVGFGGALLGAYAAYKFGQKAAREARREDRIERDKDLAQSLVQSLSSIYSAQKNTLKSIADAKNRLAVRAAQVENENQPRDANGDRVQMRLHLNQEVRPLANLPPRSAITPEQVNVGGRIGGGSTLNSLMALGDRHNGTVDLWALYGTRKAVLDQMLAQWVHYDGVYVTYSWTPEQYEPLRPLLDELDRLAGVLETQSREDTASAFSALCAVVQGMVNRGWINDGAKVTTPDGEQLTFSKVAA
jgi:hypothetical protein